jgi:aminoglycoside/choline kinase family phosphotransferase
VAQEALRDLPDDSVVVRRAFDADLLRWELDHFREWALDARGKSLSASQRRTFDEIADRIARTIAGWPRTFVHRDYQSRNLMVREPARRASPSAGAAGATGEPRAPREAFRTLVWIDFQDALLGPRVYDLVALLNDSYQTFTRGFVEARLDDFATAAHLEASERANLVREFDWVTVQRKLKDAGRFVYIDRVKGNRSFLKYVLPTIGKALGACDRLAPEDNDFARLADLLRRSGVLTGTQEEGAESW